MNSRKFLGINLRFSKNKTKNNEIPQHYPFKIHSSTEDFIFHSGLLQQNLKKFLAINHLKIYFHEIFEFLAAILNCEAEKC